MLKPFYKCKNIKLLKNLLSSNGTVLTEKGLSFEKSSYICEIRRFITVSIEARNYKLFPEL